MTSDPFERHIRERLLVCLQRIDVNERDDTYVVSVDSQRAWESWILVGLVGHSTVGRISNGGEEWDPSTWSASELGGLGIDTDDDRYVPLLEDRLHQRGHWHQEWVESDFDGWSSAAEASHVAAAEDFHAALSNAITGLHEDATLFKLLGRAVPVVVTDQEEFDSALGATRSGNPPDLIEPYLRYIQGP